MAFSDWSTTASDNVTVGGIPIQGTSPVSNFDDGLRTVMAEAKAGIDGKVVYSAKSGNYTAVANDNNALLNFTAPATLSLTAAATLAANWHLDIIATGGQVTIDPNGAETINGAATLIINNGQSARIVCTGAAFLALFNHRERLAADRTYYVRADGSNSNTGLANTAGGAFLTIQRAVDTAYSVDANAFNITIQVADGTWTEAVTANGPMVGARTLTIQGNTGTPANVVWNRTSGRCISAQSGANITVTGIEFRTTTSGECLTADGPGSKITIGAAVRFGAAAGPHMFAYGGGSIFGRSNYSIVGGTTYHTFAQAGGNIDIQGITVTLTGTPAFSSSFARSVSSSIILLGFNTFSGAATGVRYQVTTGSGIDVNGGGATYLPGGTAGTADAATYGYYA